MSEFYEGMAEILDVDVKEIRPDLQLADVAWDSLAIVSTIALVDELYGAAVNPNTLLECGSIADVEKLIEAARAED